MGVWETRNWFLEMDDTIHVPANSTIEWRLYDKKNYFLKESREITTEESQKYKTTTPTRSERHIEVWKKYPGTNKKPCHKHTFVLHVDAETADFYRRKTNVVDSAPRVGEPSHAEEL